VRAGCRSAFAVACGQPAFAGVDALENGVEFDAWADFLVDLGDGVRRGIAPPQLLRKRVPDPNLGFVRPKALRKTPLEDLLVRGAFRCSPQDLAVLEIEEMRQQTVERVVASKVLLVVVGKLSAEVEPDLVDHSPEVNEASYFIARAAQRWMFHVITLHVALSQRNDRGLSQAIAPDQLFVAQTAGFTGGEEDDHVGDVVWFTVRPIGV
jgi:hypothetical protein